MSARTVVKYCATCHKELRIYPSADDNKPIYCSKHDKAK